MATHLQEEVESKKDCIWLKMCQGNSLVTHTKLVLVLNLVGVGFGEVYHPLVSSSPCLSVRGWVDGRNEEWVWGDRFSPPP